MFYSQKPKETRQEILLKYFNHKGSPSLRSDEAEEARRKEMENLVRRDSWEVILEEDVPEDANVIIECFVIN